MWGLPSYLQGLLLSFLVLSLSSSTGGQGEEETRQDRLFNAFTVVRFPNDGCVTSTGEYGTCYTNSECTALGGSNGGSCASGFGVCCYVTAGCNGSTSVNNTYFASSSADISPCSFSVCKADDNICQIKLTFDTFNIAGPSTVNSITTTPEQTRVDRTYCRSAQFQVASPGGKSHTLCGVNSGEHMYIEADAACNKLDFTWTGTEARDWNIHIMQIPCDARWKAPAGCTQYFTGTTGTIQSYNYAGGSHLANQHVTQCIRTEQGFCSIGYTSAGTFKVGDYPPTTITPAAITTNAAGVAFTGVSCSEDFVQIPFSAATLATQPYEMRYCGEFLNAAGTGQTSQTSPATVSTTDAPVFTQNQPFLVMFQSDCGEKDRLSDNTNKAEASAGYSLTYTQTAC